MSKKHSEKFKKYITLEIKTFRSCSRIQDMTLWAFLASNSLHNHGCQKLTCPCYNTKNFEQFHWNKLFCGIYGLAVMLSISTRTTSKNIDKIFNLTTTDDLICISGMIFLCSCNYETLAWNLIFFLSNSFLFFLFWILSIDIGKKSRCTTSAEICIQL